MRHRQRYVINNGLAQVATSVQTVLCCTLSDNGDSRSWVSACNRYVALVQCCHVPLVVVFSTTVLVGHIRSKLVIFVPNERFRGLGCFPGANNSKGIFLEPASVAPSLQVFALEGYDHHASVSALAEIASGWLETDSKGTFLPSRCDMCGLTLG